jgi:hypothetical protein
VAQSNQHRNIAPTAILEQRGAGISLKGLFVSPMSHGIVLPQIVKTNNDFPYLIGLANGEIFLQELLLHLSP